MPIAIPCGDPAGVGPEVVEAALKELDGKFEVVVISEKSMAAQFDIPGVCEVIPVPSGAEEVVTGEPSESAARVAWECMEHAAKGCLEGKYRAVVTGPVSKYWLQRLGYPYPGQTEFFAARWGGVPTMAFYSETLKVSLVTWHVPFREVPEHLTEANLKRAIRNTVDWLQRLGVDLPRIGICGLNPHAGENGLLGSEEQDVLNLVIQSVRGEGFSLSDCLPADTLFYRHSQGDFDAVIAMYHDQGLAPLKLVAFHDAVNVTLGLPYIRTSPDHGTAYEIAGRGKAKPGSMLSAILLADRLSR